VVVFRSEQEKPNRWNVRSSLAGHEIEWRWVKDRAGDPGNERADALARQGIPGGDPDEAAPDG
jgi:ribonuclease HI